MVIGANKIKLIGDLAVNILERNPKVLEAIGAQPELNMSWFPNYS